MNAEQIKTEMQSLYSELEFLLGYTPLCYVAGGCIASMVLDEEVKDYDLWFENPEDFQQVLKDVLDVSASDMLDGYDNLKVKRTKYALTISLSSGKIVQFVESRMGVPEVLVPGFDFKHTQAYYKQDGTLVYDEALIKSKVLVFAQGNFKHPVNTVQRMLKFARRGYDIPFETVQAIMITTNDLEKDQISGAVKHAGSL